MFKTESNGNVFIYLFIWNVFVHVFSWDAIEDQKEKNPDKHIFLSLFLLRKFTFFNILNSDSVTLSSDYCR